MMVIRKIFLAAFLEVLLEKLESGVLEKFARQEGLGAELNKLSETLRIIQAMIGDAEEKQISDGAVKKWLEDLNDLAYHLDDLLDEFATEALRRKLMNKEPAHASTSKVWKVLIPTCCTSFPTPSAFMFDRRMRSTIEVITARLQEIVKQKNDMGLKEVTGGSRVRERLPTTTSLVDKARVYGRENDKSAIVELLQRRGGSTSDETVSVIPIVGMGGVGKTTLAQLVYDDDTMKDLFDMKAWVCVSDDFDVFGVTKTIFEKLTDQIYDFKDVDKLQVKLKEILSGKKFFFVLDDIWNENLQQWDLLRRPFLAGAPGSKIICTTRNAGVAKVMSSIPAVPTYHLRKLSHDECRSLFAQYALGSINFDAHLNLKEVGDKIVKKCNGLPLAAMTLGGILRNEFDERKWEAILHSKIYMGAATRKK